MTKPLSTVGEIDVAGNGPGLRFGTYQQHSPGTAYVAPSDGFVSAGLSTPASAGNFTLSILQGFVDGKLIATATAGNFGCFDSNWNYLRASGSASLLMPVPRGATWKVESVPHEGSEATMTAWVNWLPLAVNPFETNDEIGPSSRVDHADVVRKPWENFDPAINDLVDLLAKLFNQRLSETEKTTLAMAMKKLI